MAIREAVRVRRFFVIQSRSPVVITSLLRFKTFKKKKKYISINNILCKRKTRHVLSKEDVLAFKY